MLRDRRDRSRRCTFEQVSGVRIRILNLVPLIHLKVHAVVLNLVYTDVDLLLIFFNKKSVSRTRFQLVGMHA